MNLWFSEDEGGLRFSYKVLQVLHQDRSEFQRIDVFETETYGRMLVLDGFVMLTEQDEFVYHEMISHIPACLHKNPKRVVVIGGGDGGTVRELLKHPGIEKITLCEIDGKVVETCRKFFPEVACGLDDPRVEVNIGDGVAYMRGLENEIDLALIDSTDPIGPGEGLFTAQFYQSVARALRPGGIMAAQSESPWYRPEILRRIQRNIAGGFKHVLPYIGSIPTYPRGLWSWTLASNEPVSPADFDRERFRRIPGLKYLTEEGVSAAFALPPCFREKFQV